jgi:hypothetical protein
MAGDPKECRERAMGCMLLAKDATTEESKQAFLNLAQSWTRLAAELEDSEALLKTLTEVDLKDVPGPESLSPSGDADAQQSR